MAAEPGGLCKTNKIGHRWQKEGFFTKCILKNYRLGECVMQHLIRLFEKYMREEKIPEALLVGQNMFNQDRDI